MEYILEMSLTDKILLINEIKKNYHKVSKQWTVEKVEWLQEQITTDLKN